MQRRPLLPGRRVPHPAPGRVGARLHPPAPLGPRRATRTWSSTCPRSAAWTAGSSTTGRASPPWPPSPPASGCTSGSRSRAPRPGCSSARRDKPALLIHDLKHGVSKGTVGLNGPKDGSAFFSNFSYRTDDKLEVRPAAKGRHAPRPRHRVAGLPALQGVADRPGQRPSGPEAARPHLERGQERPLRAGGYRPDLRAPGSRSRLHPGQDGHRGGRGRDQKIPVRLQRRDHGLPERKAALLRRQHLQVPRPLVPRNRGDLRRRLPPPEEGEQRTSLRNHREHGGLGVHLPGRERRLRGARREGSLEDAARVRHARDRGLRPVAEGFLRLQLRRFQPQPGRGQAVHREGLLGREDRGPDVGRRAQEPRGAGDLWRQALRRWKPPAWSRWTSPRPSS